ncbi:MAG: sigma-E processing peptidase SpoIIGA [Clostridia bacterium]|nr:sigma-E processing peptidase SpoIIGA [Clostridia bacterium]
MTIYADILFLVDLSMDFLTLYLCARLTHRPVSPGRLLGGSALGALGSILLLVCQAGRGMVFWCGVLLSAGMTAAVFGFLSSAGAFFRQCVLVWGCGAVTGGCMSVLMSLGNPVYMDPTGGRADFLPVFLGTTGAVYGLIRLLQKRMGTKTAEVRIVLHGVTAKLTVLVDSGNLLTDPLTGRPVILVSGEAVLPLELPASGTETALTSPEYMLPVPAKGAFGTRLLWALKPDLLFVNGQKRDALVAAESVPADHFGGYAGTCPTVLI